MTTTYPDKDMAIIAGCYYATGVAKIPNDLKKYTNPRILEQFNTFEDVELYELTNSKGNVAIFGITKFREGWDLWLIDQATGRSWRT